MTRAAPGPGRDRRPAGAGVVAGVVAALVLAGCGVGSTAATTTTTTTSGDAGRVAASGPAPPMGAGTLSVLTEPQAGFSPVYSFIDHARTSVTMTMYEMEDPVAEDALIADAARGVDVRVILDRYARAANAPAEVELTAHGVHVVWSSPQFAVTHQKTICVDGAACMVMTANLTARYYASDRDFIVIDRDAADVGAVERTFAGDDAGSPDMTAPVGRDLVWSPGSRPALVGLIDRARHSLQVENEELADPAVIAALEAAGRRGVDVDLTMTDQSEWHRAFSALETSGVHVRVYAASAPLYVHAKAMVVDGSWPDRRVFVGSQNVSSTSLDRNRELGLVTTDPAVVTPVQQVLAGDFAAAAPFGAA